MRGENDCHAALPAAAIDGVPRLWAWRTGQHSRLPLCPAATASTRPLCTGEENVRPLLLSYARPASPRHP